MVQFNYYVVNQFLVCIGTYSPLCLFFYILLGCSSANLVAFSHTYTDLICAVWGHSLISVHLQPQQVCYCVRGFFSVAFTSSHVVSTFSKQMNPGHLWCRCNVCLAEITRVCTYDLWYLTVLIFWYQINSIYLC